MYAFPLSYFSGSWRKCSPTPRLSYGSRTVWGCPCTSQRGGSSVSGPSGLDVAFPGRWVSQDWAGLRKTIRTTFSCFLLITSEAKDLQLSSKHFLVSQHVAQAVLPKWGRWHGGGSDFLSEGTLPWFTVYLPFLISPHQSLRGPGMPDTFQNTHPQGNSAIPSWEPLDITNVLLTDSQWLIHSCKPYKNKAPKSDCAPLIATCYKTYRQE